MAAVLVASPTQTGPTRPSLTIQRASAPPRLEDFLTGERRDGVSADGFLVSPLGIQLDGILTEGTGDDSSFDTVWQTRGHLTDFGYVVEPGAGVRSLFSHSRRLGSRICNTDS